LARRDGHKYYEGVAQSLVCIAERGLCHWDNSEEAAALAIAAYESIGARLQSAYVQRSLAITQWKKGKLGEAGDSIGATIPLFQDSRHDIHVRYAQLLNGLLHLHSGNAVEACAVLRQATDPEIPLAESRPELLRLEYLGDVELEQGHAAEALKRYDEVLPHALALIPRGDVVAELLRRRAECYQLLGRAAEAHEEAKNALALCLELGDRYEEAATYRTLALAAADLGRHDAAKQHFDHGFAMYDDIETPYEWGKLWMSYGDWLSGAHAGPYESLDGAREAYRAACDHFERMGAELKLSQARARMVTLEARLREEGVHEFAVHEKPRPRRRPSIDRELQRRVQWAHDTFGLVTRHRPLIDMLEQVARVAPSDIPVLVLGESGTGKELIARGVHALSGRTGRLVEVNCSAVPATMMESEFFGSAQGSYTGSTRDRAGLLEEAHDGSILLDEIGEMPVDLQAKLLRFLETGEVRRIGDTTGRHVDARLIAATNRDPVKMQAGDGFRQDLYYRLAHAVFALPPLRSRGDDVALLVDHFIDQFSAETRKRVLFSRAARERLVRHPWPGNVRQLRSLMQRLVVQTADGLTVTPRDIPLVESIDTPRSFLEEMGGQEKSRILEALEKSLYIKADAARMLRMSRTTLLGKMKRYQIPG
jgi:DNA-binding NtrC family response regulator